MTIYKTTQNKRAEWYIRVTPDGELHRIQTIHECLNEIADKRGNIAMTQTFVSDLSDFPIVNGLLDESRTFAAQADYKQVMQNNARTFARLYRRFFVGASFFTADGDECFPIFRVADGCNEIDLVAGVTYPPT